MSFLVILNQHGYASFGFLFSVMNAAFSLEREREQIGCKTKHDLSQQSLLAYVARFGGTDAAPLPSVVMDHFAIKKNECSFLIK